MPQGSNPPPNAPGDGGRTVALARLVGLFRLGRHDELEALALQALGQDSGSAELLYLLGASRLSRGRDAEAEAVLAMAARLAPDDAEILGLLGVALFKLGRYAEAAQRFEAALRIEPNGYELLVNAAANAVAAGNAEAACSLASRAVALRPQGTEALMGLGNALLASNRFEEAVGVYRRAIALQPDAADLHLNLGQALGRLQRLDEAASSLRRALGLQPSFAAAHLGLGRVLHDLGDGAAAQRHFRAAAEIDPALIEAHSAYLFSLLHDASLSPEATYREHVRVGDLIEAPLRGQWRPHSNDRDPERPLRVGFVSGDLHDHPVANLIEPVWRGMRRGMNRICVYANSAVRDGTQARLQALAHEWTFVNHLSDDALAERIRGDAIDILFDLSGHTARNRLAVFARRPAPVQVTWLGYPGTTGLSAIDYRLVQDPGAGREALQATCRERLVTLRTRGFEPAPNAPEVNELPALARGYLTFASFNRLGKVNVDVISLWSRILTVLPAARMIVCAVEDDSAKQELEAAFSGFGVASGRIRYVKRMPLDEYLRLHHEVDIALDTFPYAGGTTTRHALWMGVPVLTLEGASLQQSVSAAVLLRQLDLADWVAGDQMQYVDRTRTAASDLAGLARLRRELRLRFAQYLKDTEDAQAVSFDYALRVMWRRWCEGKPPEGFSADAGGGR